MDNQYYTDERNIQIVIELLKMHGIKHIVVSPGGTNISFVASVQHDPFFKLYSAVDERSAAYIACGISAELGGAPVAINCTGATASRNYMPGLTEAFYRKLPILAITSSRRNSRIGHNFDQVTDRTVLPKDVAKLSVQIPLVHDKESEWACMIAANKALLELDHHGKGPVHINLETNYSTNFSVKDVTPVRAIYRFELKDKLPELCANKIAIMVGAHLAWTQTLTKVVDDFCDRYNAIVLCDHTSNYRGKYRAFCNLVAAQTNYNSIIKKVDLMLHIGDISSSNYNIEATEVWRINPDGEIRDTYQKLKYVFEMEEENFFEYYVHLSPEKKQNVFIEEFKKEDENIRSAVPQLPFSNAWIAKETAYRLPSRAELHLGIRNSLRFWNFFDTPETVSGYCNTGGFGIDGCMSSVIGASLLNPEKIYFCVLGDLAFFYDLNSLGNRHIGKNLRILLVNNGCGAEFWLRGSAGTLFGEEANCYIAAAGHNGAKSKCIVQHYAEDLGFKYLSASNKQEYLDQIDEFLDVSIEKSIVMEVFTKNTDERDAFTILSEIKYDDYNKMKKHVKDFTKGVIGEKGTNAVKRFFNKN